MRLSTRKQKVQSEIGKIENYEGERQNERNKEEKRQRGIEKREIYEEERQKENSKDRGTLIHGSFSSQDPPPKKEK